MIKIIDRTAYIPEYERVIGCVNDNLVEMREFYVFDSSLSDFDFKLSVQNPDGSENVIDLEKEVSSDAVILKWEIERAHLKGAGIMPAQLYATKSAGDDILKWHTLNILNFEVNLSIPEGEAFESIAPSEIEQLEQRITTAKNDAQQAAADALEAGTAAMYARESAESARDEAVLSARQAESILVKTPYIGDNGNWFVWDNDKNAFSDSGIEAGGRFRVTWAEEELLNEDMGVDFKNYNNGVVTNEGSNKIIGLIEGQRYQIGVKYYDTESLAFSDFAYAECDEEGNPFIIIDSFNDYISRIEIYDMTAMSIQNNEEELKYAQCKVYTQHELNDFELNITGVVNRPHINYLPGFYISDSTKRAIAESVINLIPNGDEVEY